jgi:hypothetical protein
MGIMGATSRNSPNNNNKQQGLSSLARTASPYTAGDLLTKSHEELVILLIHLRKEVDGLENAVRQAQAEVGAQKPLLHNPGAAGDPRGEQMLKSYQDQVHRMKDLERQVS